MGSRRHSSCHHCRCRWAEAKGIAAGAGNGDLHKPLAAAAKEAAWLGAARPRAAPEDQQAALLALVQPAERAMQEQAEGRRRISMQRNTNCALHATHRRLGALRRHAALLSAVRQPHCAKIRHAAAAIVEARSGLESSEDQYGLVLVAAEAHVELDAAAAHRRQQYARLRCAQHLVIASKLLSSPQAAGCCGCTWRGLSGRCAPGILGAAPARLWQARIPAGHCLCRSRAGPR